jgi:hypothetical protein
MEPLEFNTETDCAKLYVPLNFETKNTVIGCTDKYDVRNALNPSDETMS